MMKEKKTKTPAWRKWLRRGVLLGLVLAACALAWPKRSDETNVQPPSAALSVETPQTDERSVREAAYDKDVAALEKLMAAGAADAHTQAQAAARLERMIEEHQSEIAIEQALVQAGFQPILVLCQSGAMTVMVEQDLSAEASASVLSLCTAHADVAAENIRIMTVQP